MFQTFCDCENKCKQKKKSYGKKGHFSHSFRGFSHGGKDMVEGYPYDS